MSYRINNNKFIQMNQTQDIKDFLTEEEEILCQTKPKKSAYVLENVIRMMPFALLWLAFDSFFISMIIKFDVPNFVGFFLVPFFIMHLLPVWIWIASIIKASVGHKNIEYVVTNRKIIIKGGVVGINYQTILYPDISGVNCNVGLIDKMLKVGDVYITTKTGKYVLYDLDNPFFIYNKIQKIVTDIKTDMQYPNAFRPEENPGYKSKYTNE